MTGQVGDDGNVCALVEKFADERPPGVMRGEVGDAGEAGALAEDEPDGLAGQAPQVELAGLADRDEQRAGFVAAQRDPGVEGCVGAGGKLGEAFL